MAGGYERKDRLYQQAKSDGFRSRAAYKLVELDDKFRFFKPGSKVVDLGCYPGGWLQVAKQKCGAKGVVCGIDLRPVDPIPGIEILLGNLEDARMQARLIEISEGRFDVVLSDMSPQLTGIRFRDAARSADLVELAMTFANVSLRRGGSFVAKIFPGPESDELVVRFRKNFQTFTRHVLKSSRKTSNEFYFVGRGFQGEQASSLSSPQDEDKD